MQLLKNKINLCSFLLKKTIFIYFILFSLYKPLFSFAANVDCILILSNVNFGTIQPYDDVFEQTVSSIGVTCTNNGSDNQITYTLTFSPGLSGNMSARLAKSGIRNLAYNIYKDSPFTQILGNGLGGTVTLTNNYFLQGKASKTDYFPIYGKIPIQPMAAVGTYTDIIMVTLTY